MNLFLFKFKNYFIFTGSKKIKSKLFYILRNKLRGSLNQKRIITTFCTVCMVTIILRFRDWLCSEFSVCHLV